MHGLLGGREVVVLAGRLHLYEGHSPATTVLPIQIAYAMGARVRDLAPDAHGLPDLAGASLGDAQ